MTPRRWVVSQIGAREHYAVPRGLERLGLLDRLYTDAWCYAGAGILRHGPAPLQRLAGRYTDEIPAARVRAFNMWALQEQIRGRPREDRHHRFLRIGRDFAQRVTRAVRGEEKPSPAAAFYGFDTGSLETLEYLAERGCLTVLDQIDPGPEEERIVAEEARRWPGWELTRERVPAEYHERCRREWEAAAVVVVNSRWSAEALAKAGVDREKTVVVPCAYEGPSAPLQPRPSPGPLRVLWLGSVTLRKGIAYLLDAARQLERGTDVQISVVGPLGISRLQVSSAPGNVTFAGPVSRSRVGRAYAAADVFAFPTLSDGFGITQLEAMSHGLPVIATPNCGEVVTHEYDGLVVPPGDSQALAAAIARLDADRRLLAEMSRQARRTVRRFSIDEVTRLLLERVAELRRRTDQRARVEAQ